MYKMQATTKAEQVMWLRSLTILFELRSRVLQNLKTTIEINDCLDEVNTKAERDFSIKVITIKKF